MQQIHLINAGLAANLPAESQPDDLTPDVAVVFIGKALVSGKSVVMLSAPGMPVITLTATNLLSMAAAAKGWMVETGEVNVGMNPPIAIAAKKGSGVVHFISETPLQSWDYDTEQAKKFWRTLREIAEESQK